MSLILATVFHSVNAEPLKPQHFKHWAVVSIQRTRSPSRVKYLKLFTDLMNRKYRNAMLVMLVVLTWLENNSRVCVCLCVWAVWLSALCRQHAASTLLHTHALRQSGNSTNMTQKNITDTQIAKTNKQSSMAFKRQPTWERGIHFTQRQDVMSPHWSCQPGVKKKEIWLFLLLLKWICFFLALLIFHVFSKC